MAKIVVLSIPAHGHVNPVAPVVAELVRRGHDVLVCNHAGFAARSTAGGARFRAYPPAMSLEDVTRVLADGNLIAFFELLLSATDPLLRFTLALMAEEKPDLVIYDGTCLWGEIATRRLGLRRVSTMPFFVFELFPMAPDCAS
jgi:UDP:flavonoid glycosyltransferase YjiC (YdhE family)